AAVHLGRCANLTLKCQLQAAPAPTDKRSQRLDRNSASRMLDAFQRAPNATMLTFKIDRPDQESAASRDALHIVR
ncbi:MAG: hypothetical protein HKO68_06020, partial [Desulfobacterales bacterium]|nr:hypothetical protein [Desulfobacterales bacterium]